MLCYVPRDILSLLTDIQRGRDRLKHITLRNSACSSKFLRQFAMVLKGLLASFWAHFCAPVNGAPPNFNIPGAHSR